MCIDMTQHPDEFDYDFGISGGTDSPVAPADNGPALYTPPEEDYPSLNDTNQAPVVPAPSGGSRVARDDTPTDDDESSLLGRWKNKAQRGAREKDEYDDDDDDDSGGLSLPVSPMILSGVAVVAALVVGLFAGPYVFPSEPEIRTETVTETVAAQECVDAVLSAQENFVHSEQADLHARHVARALNTGQPHHALVQEYVAARALVDLETFDAIAAECLAVSGHTSEPEVEVEPDAPVATE